jgi:hypothetical protein
MTAEFASTEFCIRFALASLAAWRITHLLAHEDGPGDVIYRLRALGGAGFWGRLLDCFYCLSIWIAAPLTPLVTTRSAPDAMLVWLALSGAACLLERATAPPIHFERPQAVVEEQTAPESVFQED